MRSTPHVSLSGWQTWTINSMWRNLGDKPKPTSIHLWHQKFIFPDIGMLSNGSKQILILGENRHANKCFILSSQKKHDSLVFHFTFMNSKNPNSDKEDLIVLASLELKKMGLMVWWAISDMGAKWWYPQNTPKWSFLVGKPHMANVSFDLRGWRFWKQEHHKKMIHACRKSSSPSALVAEYSATYVAWLHFQVARTLDAELSDLCTIELP